MPGDNETVLVVDDEASIRLLCRVNLELDGYRVLEAESLDAARTAFAAQRVDVVLLDVHVGAEDGRTFLEEIRAGGSGAAVALFTGSADPAAIASAGADAVIPKPFLLEELVGTVRRLADG